MKIEMWPIERLKPYAHNPRKNDQAIEAMAKAITSYGFRIPILAKSSGDMVDGHLRLKAAYALNISEVPVIPCDDMTEEQIKAFRLSVNRMAELAEWDFDLLKIEMENMKLSDIDIDPIGFDNEFLQGLFSDEKQGLTDPDDIPDLPEDEPTITKPGDVWLLGNHRLLCGDSTMKNDVERLMGGGKAMVMQTDPPYGVAYDNALRPNPGVAKPRVAKPRVANDDKIDGEEMQSFLENMLTASMDCMDDHAAYYFWHPMLAQGTYVAAAAAAAAGILIHRQIIWVKPVLLLGRGDYHWKHELCFYGWKKGNRPPFYGPRNQHTIWEIGNVSQRERREYNHATPKPVDLFIAPILNHTTIGQVLYEPFAGSGPQFIAAEQTNRVCYGMDIDPHYCDVIVKRWENFTGKTAVLA
jgi:DNA modification methylase